jgi:tetratricopeptide (TPR) repeat protein
MSSINIFISYSHFDEDYKEKLEKHLSILKRNNIIKTWNDRKILPGEEWDNKIKEELESAQIILLLVSVDFLNSDYCYDVEIKRAVEKHEKGEAIVIPIILRKCDWHNTSFSKIQGLPKNAKPVKSYDDEDEAFYSIAEGIKDSVKELNKKLVEIKVKDLTEEIDKSVTIFHKLKSECDTPPNILHWAGRQNEIAQIASDLNKVIIISGIGGQGKSGLASHYIKEIALKDTKWEFWDWRDCQEKENRIHTKIISIISRLTNRRIEANQIAEERIDDLINLLFIELDKRKIIFVFDNIDAYVEYEAFQLTGAIQKLYKAALTKNHDSKFIFTCRAAINDVDPELLQIKLQGLSSEQTQMLFKDYKLSFKSEEIILLANRAYDLTRGHPLWLNLIAAQARRGLQIAEEFLTGISSNTSFHEESLSSMLSNKILGAIWNSLNDKQKTLLMAFAEIVRAENYDNLSTILSSELNYNQFNKSFKALQQLNLIVSKSIIDESDTFELHPLVKEYVIQNFGRVERSKFISLFVNFYDGVILILKPKLNSDQPFSFFENWTVKVELAVNKDDYKSALLALEEVSEPICDAGYVEEYIRVANLVFINIDWKSAIAEELSYFNSQFTKFVDTLTEFGKFDEASAFLTKYEKIIVSKGANFIRLSKSKSHFFWFQTKFNEAIKIAEDAISLEDQSSTNSGIDLKHSLALALRDSKVKSNIKRALEIFLNGKEIKNLVDDKEDAFISGETYGNVGRCLQYLGKIDAAIICYKRSLNKLKDTMNKGYGNLWVAECMIAQNKIDNALWFYVQCHKIWKIVSPIKALTVDKKIRAILEINPSLSHIYGLSDDEVSLYCLNILRTSSDL